MPVLDSNSLEFISRSAGQTRRLGMRFGTLLKTGDVICLAGELGSGKTTFVQGIASGWGSLDPVSSPSFVLVNVYRGADGQRLYHLDAYRLENAAQAAELDVDIMLETGLLVGMGPSEPCRRNIYGALWGDDQRMVFSARGARYQGLLTLISKIIYGVK
jgi:tRNA threonylcarbamoyladenosine biosynthesis protein TsaE